MDVVPTIRWYSLAKLARPPANFRDTSGVWECMTGGAQDLPAALAEVLVELEFHAAGSSGTVT
jgi:hypothetical protein